MHVELVSAATLASAGALQRLDFTRTAIDQWYLQVNCGDMTEIS